MKNKIDLSDVYIAKVEVVINRSGGETYPYDGIFLVRPIYRKFPHTLIGYKELITGKQVMKRKRLATNFDMGYVYRLIDVDSDITTLYSNGIVADKGELNWEVLTAHTVRELLTEEEIESYFNQSAEDIEISLTSLKEKGAELIALRYREEHLSHNVLLKKKVL